MEAIASGVGERWRSRRTGTPVSVIGLRIPQDYTPGK
jgi:hypothetical protein